MGAISTSQILAPIGISILFIGSLVGFAAVFVPKQAFSVVAGVLCIIGGVFILSALLVLFAAPVYDNVGTRPDDYEPIYMEGISQAFGKTSMIVGIISGIVLLVSAKFTGEKNTTV